MFKRKRALQMGNAVRGSAGSAAEIDNKRRPPFVPFCRVKKKLRVGEKPGKRFTGGERPCDIGQDVAKMIKKKVDLAVLNGWECP
jgi:hypothetical protein